MSKKGDEDKKSEHNEEEEKLAQLDKEELDKIADEDEEDLKLLKEVSVQIREKASIYFATKQLERGN